jgi:hypothetical protein
MRVIRWLSALLLAAPVAARAQTPAATPAPPREPLKNIPIAGDRPVTLTIGGQARWREEFFRGFNTLDIDDDHAQSRLLISADLVAGRRQRLYGRVSTELRDDQSYGRSLPGGARPQDEDRHDIQTLQLEVGRTQSFLRVGRQEVALAQQRLIGVADWSNTRRSVDGAHLLLVRGPLAFEAVAVRPVLVRQTRANRADSTQRLRTLSIGSAPNAKPLARGLPALWQGYWYEQAIHPANRTTARTYRLTSGGRLQWQWGGAKTRLARSLEFEGALQRGTVGARDIAAHFWIAEAQLQWKRARGAPSLALGIEEASGENPGTSTQLEAFAVLYPAAHAHGGYADVFGRTNVRELHAISTWDPSHALNLRAALYHFSRLRTDDGVYSKQNTVFRATNATNARHVADELDLTGTWRLASHWRVIFGGAIVKPGAFLNAPPPLARTEQWAFIGTTVIF